MKFYLPQLLWYGNTTTEIDLPDEWLVDYCPMRGAKRTPLKQAEIDAAVLNPIGAPRLKTLARGKKSAVIIFDDMTRPTRTYEIAPVILAELLAGGIREENITKDLVIANAFAKANEMIISIRLGVYALKGLSGTVVVIANSPEGQVIHYLLGRFGKAYGGRQYPVGAVPPNVNVIIMAPYLDKTFGDWLANSEVVTWTRNWEQTLAVLKGSFGPGTRAAVVPNATMQYFSTWT